MAQQKKHNNKNNNNNKNSSGGLNSTVKGTIAIMFTLLVVVIVIMIFAKALFIGRNNDKTPEKTGAYKDNISYAENPVTTAKTKSTTKDEFFADDGDEFDDDDSEQTDEKGNKAVEISCTSAVYLHPQPSSSSENLDTIPQGAKVKFYRNENGWYYGEYNGKKGYAWQSFFTAPQTEATTAGQ